MGKKTEWSFPLVLYRNRLGAGAAGTFLPQPPTSLRATWPGRPLVRPPASISLSKRGEVACLLHQSLPRAGTPRLGARRARDHGELRSNVALSPPVVGRRGRSGGRSRPARSPRRRAAPSFSVVPGEPQPWPLWPPACSSGCSAARTALLFPQPMACEVR